MGYFQDGPISLSMKQVLEIHYGLKVMMGGEHLQEHESHNPRATLFYDIFQRRKSKF